MKNIVILVGLVYLLLFNQNLAGAATPATTPATLSSKPVEKNGLQVTVKLAKATFTVDEPLKFTVYFKNVSERAFTLHDVEWFWNWAIRFDDTTRKGPWQLHLQVKLKRAQIPDRTCQSGETVEVPVVLGKDALPHHFTWEGEQDKPVPPLQQLHPGKYRLSIVIPHNVLFWKGTLATEPVELEITDKPAAPATHPTTASSATSLPADPVTAIRAALPQGWRILKVVKDTHPSYRPKGQGTAIILVSPQHTGRKQQEDAVIYLMPLNYNDGGKDPTGEKAQTWPAKLVGTTPTRKVYFWDSGARGWPTLENDIRKALGLPKD